MDSMPEVQRCFGTFPLKYATFLISIFGLASGGIGLSGIIMYGLIEKALASYFYNQSNIEIDDAVRKATLLSIGLTSLLLLVANTLLFLGSTTKSRGALAAGIWILLAMCMILIIAAIAAPVSCFFLKAACIIKKMSSTLMIFAAVAATIFLEIWLYFLVVASNYLIQI